VKGDAVRERERGVGVPKDVQRPRREAGRLPLGTEPVRQSVRVKRAAEFVGEDEVVVDVCIAYEGMLEQLRLAMSLKRLDGLAVERDRAKTAL
jgi:hypothetical protein